MATSVNERRRIMLLTGASRGIGHATVKRFSAAGWRVITCSRHAFPENCPWEMGPEDHLQVDLSDPDDTRSGIAETKQRLAPWFPDGLAARSREVPSQIMRDKTARQDTIVGILVGSNLGYLSLGIPNGDCYHSIYRWVQDLNSPLCRLLSIVGSR